MLPSPAPSGQTICRTEPKRTANTSCGVTSPELEQTVRTALAGTPSAGGVSVQRPISQTCPARTCYQDIAGGCTNVGGLNQATINSLIALNEFCRRQFNKNCVIITGGNECGHASHGPPNIVDLDDKPRCTVLDKGGSLLDRCRIDAALIYYALKNAGYSEQKGAGSPGTFQCEIDGRYTRCFGWLLGSFDNDIDHLHVNVR